MENVQGLKKRLKSIGNINKITKAMELVAATKMRRSQEIALASRPYAFLALDLLANVSLLNKDLPDLLKPRKIHNTLFVLVASDKGLAGAFNSSVFKKFENFLKENSAGEKIFLAVGEKSYAYLKKRSLQMVKKPEHQMPGARPSTESEDSVLRFTNVGDHTTPEQVQPLADFLVDGYLKGDFDRVVVFSTHFRSALKQESLMRSVLPISFESIQQTVKDIIRDKGKFADVIKEQQISFMPNKEKLQEYIIEPSAKEVLADLAKHLFFMQMYHLILEANASEHAARRMAMKTASDNAKDLGQELSLQYNKVRQGLITSQIIEIIAGAESLN